MESKKDRIKQFRFVKRKLSRHLSIINRFSAKQLQLLKERSPQRSPKKSPNKSPYKSRQSKKTMSEQDECVKKIKEIYMNNKKGFVYNKKYDLSKYEEPELDYGAITKFLLGSYDEEFQKLLQILTSPYSERNEEESNYLLSFLTKIKINEILKTDMLLTELTIPELFRYFKPYIFGEHYDTMDTIYYNGEEVDNLYVVLHGSFGQYRLEVYEEELTCEEYFIFLSDCYNLYQEEMELGYILTEEEEPKKKYKINKKPGLLNNNINSIKNIKIEKKESQKKKEEEDDSSDEEDNKEQYIDHYLICQMVDENKEIYPLKDISDLVRLKKIIFKLRLFTILNDLKLRDAELLYLLYEYPTTYLNFDKVLDGIVPVPKYIEVLSYNFKQYDYFYIKLLGPLKHKVKLMKYVKYKKNLEPYSFFGNYELINPGAKRNLTVRCEEDDSILLGINKRMYSIALYNAQKNKRDKELELMHNFYLFKNTSKKYFNRRIFSQFKINNFFKDNILFKQNERMNHFIFIKEGIVELSLQNITFVEFHKLIKETKEAIMKKGKELRINMKEFFDFNTNVESKTNYNLNTLKGILNQKQNFVFQRNEKGIFGDYELFFDIPAILTGTVISDKCLLYFYGYNKYKGLTEETYLLNDSLRYNSFLKLKSLLKRMVMVYNSYWRLNLEQLSENLKEKEKILSILNEEEKEQSKKSVFNSTNLKNTPLIDNIYNIKSNDKNISLNFFNENTSHGRNYLLFKNPENSNNINKQYFMNTTHNNIYNNNNLLNSRYKGNITISNNNNSFKNKSNINQSSSQSKKNNKLLFSKDNFKRKGFSVKKKTIINDFGKEETIYYKVNKDEEYQKRLIKDFKQTINAQRVASKKEQKKIFLPPINYSSQQFYNPHLNTEVNYNKKNNIKYKKLDENENSNKNKNNTIKSNIKERNRLNLNDSLIINNSYSVDKAKSKYDDTEDDIQLNFKKIHDGLKKNLYMNIKTSKIKKKFDFKKAQLYNIQYRKDKRNNSMEKSSSTFN